MDIGKRLREARINKNLVIDDLSSATGLSRAYISQVETGKASPSLQTIEKLALALKITVSSLFIEDNVSCTVIRSEQHRHVYFGTPGSRYRKAMKYMSETNRQLELVMIDIPPHSTAIDKAHVHEGEEACHVLEGKIEVVHGGTVHLLESGDSIHWDSRVPHWIKNEDDVPARLILARTPAGLMDMQFSDSVTEDTVPQNCG